MKEIQDSNTINRIYKLYNRQETNEYQGFCKKVYCDINGEHGIFKEKMSTRSIDNVMESFIYQVSLRFKVPCAFAKVRMAEGVIGSFSRFEIKTGWDFEHCSKLYGQSELFALDLMNETVRLFGMQSNLTKRLYQYLIFDFITGQQDRHLDNLAIIKNQNGRLAFYKLYDNGLCMESHNNNDVAIQVLNEGFYKSSMGVSEHILDTIREYSIRLNLKPINMVDIHWVSFNELVNILSGCDIYKQVRKDRKEAIAKFVISQLDKVIKI